MNPTEERPKEVELEAGEVPLQDAMLQQMLKAHAGVPPYAFQRTKLSEQKSIFAIGRPEASDSDQVYISPALIEEPPGADWRDLQMRVAAILTECGLKAEPTKSVKTARGTTEVDVYAVDPQTIPPAIYFCECKRWQTNVPQGEVQAFRTVVSDGGANFGLVISAKGFQQGAFDVVAHTNIRLADWREFQTLFLDRWYWTHMVPAVKSAGDALIQYTEFFNSRIARRAAALATDRFARFRELQDRHFAPAIDLWILMVTGRLALPLRASLTREAIELPDSILDATALRPLMESIAEYYRAATAEFDEVFDGRA